MNWVRQHRKELEKRNYVLKADISSHYWFGLSRNKLDNYKLAFNNQFNIVLFGSDTIQGDFYNIPYIALDDLLTISNLYIHEGRERWVGDIKNHILSIRNTNKTRNISEYYSAPKTILTHQIRIDANDYAIENAKREVQVRLKQSIFRKKVLDNFNNRCCLTGITESDLLVASHIIPWAAKVEGRLSPHNGLCLSVLYDKLFDKGYFTLNNELKVLITPRIDRLSDPVKTLLIEISKCKITLPIMYEISTISLEFHRQFIFDKFVI